MRAFYRCLLQICKTRNICVRIRNHHNLISLLWLFLQWCKARNICRDSFTCKLLNSIMNSSVQIYSFLDGSDPTLPYWQEQCPAVTSWGAAKAGNNTRDIACLRKKGVHARALTEGEASGVASGARWNAWHATAPSGFLQRKARQRELGGRWGGLYSLSSGEECWTRWKKASIADWTQDSGIRSTWLVPGRWDTHTLGTMSKREQNQAVSNTPNQSKNLYSLHLLRFKVKVLTRMDVLNSSTDMISFHSPHCVLGWLHTNTPLRRTRGISLPFHSRGSRSRTPCCGPASVV